MKVYVLQFHDYEGSFFNSVWSRPELAEAEKARLNNLNKSSPFSIDYKPSYDYEEIEVDIPAEEIEVDIPAYEL